MPAKPSRKLTAQIVESRNHLTAVLYWYIHKAKTDDARANCRKVLGELKLCRTIEDLEKAENTVNKLIC